MTDPISDMLTRIRNAVSAKHARVDMPACKLKAEIARILQDEGYIQGFRLVEEPAEQGRQPPRQLIRLFLKYGPHGEKVITGHRAHQPSGPPRLLRRRGRADGARRARHQHPDDLARRDDRPRGQEGRRRRRSALQRVVAASRGSAEARRSEQCLELERNRSRSRRASRVKIAAGAVEVKGPKGKLRQALPPGIALRAGRRRARGEARARGRRSCGSSTAWRAAWSPTP